MFRRASCSAALVLVVAAAASSAPNPGRELSAAAVDATSPITLDGRVVEDAWSQAPIAHGFVQREPREGAPASFDTDVRVLCDQTHLYVGVVAHDPEPTAIVGLLTRRDSSSPSDWIRVLVDSYHDRRSAFEFGVNPVGVKQDRYWFNDSSYDDGWDAVWDVAVARTDGGWQAEFRIPLSQLRLSARADADTRFGFAVVREIGRLKEVTSWPLLPRSANGYVSSFGDLTGLRGGLATRRLELVPYSVSQVTTEPVESGNPFRRSPDSSVSAGLDFKYALTPGLTLTGTLNPDFGQVEADPAVVNLSAFETFFPERRPFFVEGAGAFRFDLSCSDDVCSGLFYSRRIGRAPQAAPDAPDDGFSSSPAQTTLLGASKLTGRVGAATVGVLHALTGTEYGHVAYADGSRVTSTAEPMTSYTVARVRREFANQSSIGFMTTATNRRGAALLSLASQAYAGGVDWDWRLSSAYRLSGYWAGSTLFGQASAIDAIQTSTRHAFQRPDASTPRYDPGRTSLAGQAAQVGLSKIGGERIRFSLFASLKTPGFEVNDVGFMRRADSKETSAWLQWRNDRPGRLTRSVRLNLNYWQGWNFDNDRTSLGGNVNAHATFLNSWRTGGGITRSARNVDDRLTRGGPSGVIDARTSAWTYLESDDRRPVSVNASAYAMTDHRRSSEWESEVRATVRPGPALSTSAGIRLAHTLDDRQWIENVSDTLGPWIFGRLDQRTIGLTFRANYTLRPTISLQLYAEPFVSAGRYTDFRTLTNGRAPRYADRFAPYAYESTPDFRYRSFRATNVFRWEYRPGSTLFVVWQQGREQTDDIGIFRAGYDLARTFSTPGRNTLLVKVAYWVNR